MNNYPEMDVCNNAEDWRWEEVRNLPQQAIDHVTRVSNGHKVDTLVQGSAILLHDLVASTALMCQAELEAKAAYIIQRNPQASTNIRELTTANMLYLRRKIFDPDDRR